MTPCEPWPLYIDPKSGYGVKRVKGKLVGAHRWTWMQAYGPIPEGLYVCHHCDNPSCVRLSHLFLGTPVQNNADRDAKGRRRGNGQKEWTHCKAGHEFTPENTRIKKTNGQRVCKICEARWQREYVARRRSDTEVSQ